MNAFNKTALCACAVLAAGLTGCTTEKVYTSAPPSHTTVIERPVPQSSVDVNLHERTSPEPQVQNNIKVER
jgi:hypothetical protein